MGLRFFLRSGWQILGVQARLEKVYLLLVRRVAIIMHPPQTVTPLMDLLRQTHRLSTLLLLSHLTETVAIVRC